MDEPITVLLATLLGGALAVIGIITRRHELRREQRIRMHTTTIPGLLRHLKLPTEQEEGQIEFGLSLVEPGEVSHLLADLELSTVLLGRWTGRRERQLVAGLCRRTKKPG